MKLFGLGLCLKIPKGFYENYDFRKINDAILLDSGYKVKDYKTIIPIPKVSKRAKMIKTIQNV